MIFFRWDLKTPCIKSNEYESQKKNDSDSNFYNFSLLVPYPKYFLLVCICVLFFHDIYPLPLPTNIYFLRGLKHFFESCSYGLGKFQISLAPSALGVPNSLFGRKGLAIFFCKAISDQSCKLKNS